MYQRKTATAKENAIAIVSKYAFVGKKPRKHVRLRGTFLFV
jgi:hypothetical protein